MFTRTLTTRKTLAAASLLSLLLLFQPRAAAQQGNPGRFRQFMQNLAAFSGGSVVGTWRGAKTENDPIHGGYLNLTFAFVFAADGQYEEAAYMGSRQSCTPPEPISNPAPPSASTLSNAISPAPNWVRSSASSQSPLIAPPQDSIAFSALQGGPQMSLKDARLR